MVKEYQLELVCFPHQVFNPCPQRSLIHALVTEEVEKLVTKQAILPVTPVADQFMSRIFTVPKKDGSKRLVVNLKPLNCFVKKYHFKMEGASMLRHLLQKHDWMVSIDRTLNRR